MKNNGFSVSNGTGIEQLLPGPPSAGGTGKALVANQLLLEWVTLTVTSASARMRCEMSCKNAYFQKHYKDGCKDASHNEGFSFQTSWILWSHLSSVDLHVRVLTELLFPGSLEHTKFTRKTV